MLIRYPGSKEKIADSIMRSFPDEMSLPLWMNHNRWEYREPFFGAGAVGIRILELLPPGCSAWINDKDYGIVSLWISVRDLIKDLCQKIKTFTPSVEHYNKFKEEDGIKTIDPLEAGFRKLALHQMSYSGLGFMSGGPLGGQTQKNELYKINCRWNVSNLTETATKIHKIFRKLPELKITCEDFTNLIDDNQKSFIYLDPPYYKQGGVLYKYFFTDRDHNRLMQALKARPYRWLLSYDNCSEIRTLYNWADIEEIKITYTISNKNGNRKNQEVLISPPGAVPVNGKNGHVKSIFIPTMASNS